MIKNFLKSAVLSAMLLSTCAINNSSALNYKAGVSVGTSAATLAVGAEAYMGNIFYGADLHFGIKFTSMPNYYGISEDCKESMNNPEKIKEFFVDEADKAAYSSKRVQDVLSGNNLFKQEVYQFGIDNKAKIDESFEMGKAQWNDKDNKFKCLGLVGDAIGFEVVEKTSVLFSDARKDLLNNRYGKYIFDNELAGGVVLSFKPNQRGKGDAPATGAGIHNAGLSATIGDAAANMTSWFFGQPLAKVGNAYTGGAIAGAAHIATYIVADPSTAGVAVQKTALKAAKFEEVITSWDLKKFLSNTDIKLKGQNNNTATPIVAGAYNEVDVEFNANKIFLNTYIAHDDAAKHKVIFEQVFSDTDKQEPKLKVDKEEVSFNKDDIEGNSRFTIQRLANTAFSNQLQFAKADEAYTHELLKKAYNKAVKDNSGSSFLSKIKFGSEFYCGYILNDIFGLDHDTLVVKGKMVFDPLAAVSGLMSGSKLADGYEVTGQLYKWADIVKLGGEVSFKLLDISSYTLNANVEFFVKPMGIVGAVKKTEVKVSSDENTEVDDNDASANAAAEMTPSGKVKDAFSIVANNSTDKYARSGYSKVADSIEFRLLFSIGA